MTQSSELLLETAQRGELHHAVIIHGPVRAVMGQLALQIAKTLNCENGSIGDRCASCEKIARGMHPDVHLVTIAEDRKLISVEQIRSAVSEAGLRPYEGRSKVFIVDPADAMTTNAANAMLKTLEEPSRDTFFILITGVADLLLPTIRSRCQALHVRPDIESTAIDLAEKKRAPLQLVRLEQSDPVLHDGDVDRASSLASDIVERLYAYASRDEMAALLRLAAELADADDPKIDFAIFAAVLRDIVGLDPGDSIDPEKVAVIRQRIDDGKLLATAEASLRAAQFLNVNADVRLVIEDAVLSLKK